MAKGSLVKIKVVCLECGKKFSTASMLPTCTSCGGSDIEVAPRPLSPEEWAEVAFEARFAS